MEEHIKQDLLAHEEMKTLEQYLQRFYKANYKATAYEKFVLGVMLNKIEWVIKNCLEEKE